MILADTSVWVDHFRSGNRKLTALLDAASVLIHPAVIGEIALGHLPRRQFVLAALRNLPRADAATDQEVLRFIDDQSLFGHGIGYVDAQLLAATRLTAGATLWTLNARLKAAAGQLGVAAAVA